MTPKSLMQTASSCMDIYPDSKVHGANMGPTWVLSAPDGPHVGPMNLAIGVVERVPLSGQWTQLAPTRHFHLGMSTKECWKKSDNCILHYHKFYSDVLISIKIFFFMWIKIVLMYEQSVRKLIIHRNNFPFMSHYPLDTSTSGQWSDLFHNIWLISPFPNFSSATVEV